ncbi:hypothetical protein FQ085_11615 [Planococcus sp. ANT_H30]|uniref:phage head-tail connector protein n=1 Tax=Planococcus sp. ANT_H30 TaxID=2597347 RepID=UPI0011EC8BC1|nr:phage head-tail connector protein [Planococcus sp. ANT_H30]KAA0956634.1 hypothetical protein FQ085_11615 [Planococcus sp. ANT_H30]
MHIEFIPTQNDVNEIKGIMGVAFADDSKDEYIKTMLPLLLESVMAYTNNTFGITTEGTLRIPGGVKIYLAKAIERNTLATGLKSRSMGSVSYSYDTEVTSELKGLLTPYKKVKFHASR